mgnify:FL=1
MVTIVFSFSALESVGHCSDAHIHVRTQMHTDPFLFGLVAGGHKFIFVSRSWKYRSLLLFGFPCSVLLFGFVPVSPR